MGELKTLKDLEECTCCGCNIDGHCEIDTLRQEAINWLKEYPPWKGERLSDLTVEWIKHFFNIEESDL